MNKSKIDKNSSDFLDKKFSSEKKFQTIFNYITDFIVLCNSEFEIIESNMSANVILGKGDSIVGSKCYEMFHSKNERCHDCPLPSTIKSGTIIPIITYDERFGEYFEERVHPLLSDDDDIRGFIVVGRNASKSRELEDKSAQLKKLAALGRISSGVAHDFNNVLTGVLGRVQLMKRQINDAYILSSLDMVEKAALDGAAKVRRMQEFSRSKKIGVTENIDLKQLILDVVDLTRPKWKDATVLKGIIIEPILELTDSLYILGDPSDLRNAFTNIIFNAVDAMPEGGVITISTERNNDNALFKFKDNGIGMTEETVEKIFDPFFTTKGTKGTGLGMSEVYGVIKRHGGQINANSKVGQGTTITIIFPAVKKAEDKLKPEKHLESAPSRILVIDDEEYILDMMSEILSEFGHKVATFSSPSKALEDFQKSNYNIVITDFGMPEMSGLEVANRIKKINKLTQVILLSGWSVNKDEKEIEDVIDLILHKPFSMEEIKYVISEAISKSKQS